MPKSIVPIASRLPNTGTSIFAVMSALANQHHAINLSQGFPDFPVSEEIIALVHAHMRQGHNQYAPMPGVLPLREAISEKIQNTYGEYYHPETEITITAGATEALYCVITAMVHPGDEVIIIEPAYDSYAPAVELCGGAVKRTSLQAPDYQVDWEHLRSLVSPRTRMVLINSPHNPTGSVLSANDMMQLQEIVRDTSILVLSDEVYEHLIFDGLKHESVCQYPELAVRSFAIGSFGKTFHATGWKTGYIAAPASLTAEVRKVHQFVVFASNTPVQYAMAEYLRDPAHYLYLPDFYASKRDFFLQNLKGSRFGMVPSRGTYFQLLDFSAISSETESDFAVHLTRHFGVAAVPVSAFYQDKTDRKVLRFCFAKTEETLQKACEILVRV